MNSTAQLRYPAKPIPGTGPGTLYVFVHGFICLVEAKDKFLGFVVDLGDDHSYRAGDWLVETPIKRGAQMKLNGVEAGRGGLDASKITIVRKPLAKSTRHFATIELPKPKTTVRSIRRTRIPASLVSGSGAASLNQTADHTFTVAAVHILEYDFAELSDVVLENGAWGPPTVFRDSRAATLHLFAEPEQIKPVAHQIDEFGKAAKLFTGFDVSISAAVTMAKLETAEYPPDLSSNEALSLIERRFVLTSLAAGYKEGTPGDLPAASEGSSGGVLCAPMPGDDSSN